MYRLLTAAELFPDGALGRLGRHVICFDQIDSTNAFLLRQSRTLPDGSVALAEYQTAGRGRQGRSWVAPRGSSILLSVLLFEPPESRAGVGRPAANGEPFTPLAAMLVAVAACEAIESSTDVRPALRWPNDIVVADRKVGGVLAECTTLERANRAATRAAGADLRVLVIGVGINCYQNMGHFSGELAGSATSLEIQSARPVDRAAVARQLVARLDAQLGAYADPRGGAQRLRQAWLARCQDVGARAALQQDGRIFQGTVLDVTENGDLLVELDSGARRYFASATTTRIA